MVCVVFFVVVFVSIVVFVFLILGKDDLGFVEEFEIVLDDIENFFCFGVLEFDEDKDVLYIDFFDIFDFFWFLYEEFFGFDDEDENDFFFFEDESVCFNNFISFVKFGFYKC